MIAKSLKILEAYPVDCIERVKYEKLINKSGVENIYQGSFYAVK